MRRGKLSEMSSLMRVWSIGLVRCSHWLSLGALGSIGVLVEIILPEIFDLGAFLLQANAPSPADQWWWLPRPWSSVALRIVPGWPCLRWPSLLLAGSHFAVTALPAATVSWLLLCPSSQGHSCSWSHFLETWVEGRPWGIRTPSLPTASVRNTAHHFALQPPLTDGSWSQRLDFHPPSGCRCLGGLTVWSGIW